MLRVKGRVDALPFRRPDYRLVCFDCDSTLSRIEGIDEIARLKGRYEDVMNLTRAAMEGEVHLESVYDQRLRLLKPTRSDLRRIEKKYAETVTEDASAVIKALQRLNKETFIVSGGLSPAVIPFGVSLGISPDHIFAVDLNFNELAGEWWDYQEDRWGGSLQAEYLNYHPGPLTESAGKTDVVQAIRRQYEGSLVLIGDGISDLNAHRVANLFIGYGGVTAREKVAAEAPVFIRCESLSPLLPILASGVLQPDCKDEDIALLYRKGLHLIAEDAVTFKDPQWRADLLQNYS
jgi:phosphoserine phosphatase